MEDIILRFSDSEIVQLKRFEFAISSTYRFFSAEEQSAPQLFPSSGYSTSAATMAASSGAMLHHFKNKADQQRKRTQPGSYPVLHDYVLLDPIGRGAFGEVRLALNLNTMDRVAVKVILKDLARRKMSTANVRREIMIMQQVQHPNVVRFIDVYSTRSKIFIMMELVTGGE
eukprot:IDg13821t1